MQLAAVCYDPGNGQEVDTLLERMASDLRGEGYRLAGTVQVNHPGQHSCRCVMTLVDLASGTHIVASEDRGRHAQGCRLDVRALEEAVGLAAASVADDAQLLIVNRFGKREGEGRGFRPVIEAAVLDSTPVIVGLNVAQVESWKAFAGDDAVLLDANDAAVRAWCTSALAAAAKERGTAATRAVTDN